LTKKTIKSKIEASQILTEITNSFEVVTIEPVTVLEAGKIASDHLFSIYDSLILSAAIKSNCRIIYSEDLQHNQLIKKILRVVNPFIIAPNSEK
jgi:predicted nucleic acid-binding protein